MKKLDEVREQARQMCLSGISYNEISKRLGVNKSSISYWCRDIISERRLKRQEENPTPPVVKKKKAPSPPGFPGEGPYKGYFVHKSTRKDRLDYVNLRDPKTRTHLTMSLSRYLMSVKENRILTSKEQVFYQDGPKDDVNSYLLMTRREMSEKYRKDRGRICANTNCSNLFYDSHSYRKFCSTECAHTGRKKRLKLVKKITMIRRICEWCEKPFETTIQNKDICSEECKTSLAQFGGGAL